MTTEQAITISYLPEQEDCKGVLFELPTAEVEPGDSVELRLWGGTYDLLLPYTLYKGTVTLGAGEMVESDIVTIQPIINFAETFKQQLDWPIDSIDNIEAITEIFIVNDDNEIETWATKGDNITSRFSRSGYSCIIADDRIPLYGSIRATCTRSKWMKRWYWTIPAGAEGLYWFFIYKENMVLDHKFSIALPDLAEATLEYRNIIIRVVDKDTDTIKENAEVTIDGIVVGATDEFGELSIDNILTGNHTLKITGDSFLDTDTDNLNNDSFVVY